LQICNVHKSQRLECQPLRQLRERYKLSRSSNLAIQLGLRFGIRVRAEIHGQRFPAVHGLDAKVKSRFPVTIETLSHKETAKTLVDQKRRKYSHIPIWYHVMGRAIGIMPWLHWSSQTPLAVRVRLTLQPLSFRTDYRIFVFLLQRVSLVSTRGKSKRRQREAKDISLL